MNETITQLPGQPRMHTAIFGRRPQKALSAGVWYLILGFVSLLVVIPFIWMLSTSFKSANEVFSYPISWLPNQLRWENYVNAWKAAPFARYFFNSFFIAFAVTFGQLISCSLAAFAFARMNFKGKNFMFTLFLSTTMISTQVTLIPSFLVIKYLNWQDTYQGLIVPFLANAFGVFMIRQAFLSLPRELEDAAKLDGCSRLRFLWQIAIPLTRPVLSAQALFAFMGNWNSYLWPLVVTNRQEMRTLQIGLRYFVSQEGGTQWGVYMAAAVMVTIPVILFYFLVQKSFVEGIATTGIKR
ncbi:MAG: carbohydrate ABC transporter permease [Anaerolineales bacterium]|nr:carbohydrate ABC transporter permease [Anaerolineales bacterium]